MKIFQLSLIAILSLGSQATYAGGGSDGDLRRTVSAPVRLSSEPSGEIQRSSTAPPELGTPSPIPPLRRTYRFIQWPGESDSQTFQRVLTREDG